MKIQKKNWGGGVGGGEGSGGGGQAGIFFRCLRGRYKAPVPMANTHIFSQFGPKNSQSEGIFLCKSIG